MPNYLDLFAGAGGLSEGFNRAGYTPIAHVEMDVAACFTLKTRAAFHWLGKNSKGRRRYRRYLEARFSRDEFYSKIPEEVLDSVLNYEISEDTLPEIFQNVDGKLNGEPLDLIIGGPPCQAYSLAGRSRSENRMLGDQRNYLYRYYAQFLKRYQPRYFVFENVLGLLSARDEDGTLHFDNMQNLFQECGYTMDYRILNASNYGVLQNRKRIILIGSRNDMEHGYPDIPEIPNPHTVNDLLRDLPPIHAGEGEMGPVETLPYEADGYLFQSSIKTGNRQAVTLHQARPNKEQDLEIYRLAVETWNNEHRRISYRDLPERLQTHKNTTSFLDRFKVVAGDLPYSQTVVAHIARDGHYYIHPNIEQNRSLTPREAARLQTFPDDYYFESVSGRPSRTLAYKQIGNAVPVCLAHSIAQALLPYFE